MIDTPGGDASVRIVIVGPENAGRRWLLLTLPRALAKYQDDLDFEYRVEEILDRIDSRPIMPDIESEDKVPDVLWRFGRSAKLGTYANILSSHSHVINVMSLSIDDLHVIRSDNKDIDHFLFILLDPTRFSEAPIEHKLNNDVTPPEHITRSVYKEFVEAALDEAAFISGKNWSVAAIVTKGDLLDHDKQGWNLIRHEFGENMELVFRQNSNRFKDIQPFRVSAFGYFLDNGEKRPNPNPLLYDQVWQPEVEAPFFWAFQTAELHRLENVDWITRLLFRNQRKQLYKPYKVGFSSFNKNM